MMRPMVAAPSFMPIRLRFTLTDGQPLILLHAGVVAIVGRKSAVNVVGEGYREAQTESTITVLHDSFLRDYDVTETPDQVQAVIDDMFAKLAKAHDPS